MYPMSCYTNAVRLFLNLAEVTKKILKFDEWQNVVHSLKGKI